jgi:hypothetical protein
MPRYKGLGIGHYSLTLKCLAHESLRLVQNSDINWGLRSAKDGKKKMACQDQDAVAVLLAR